MKPAAFIVPVIVVVTVGLAVYGYQASQRDIQPAITPMVSDTAPSAPTVVSTTPTAVAAIQLSGELATNYYAFSAENFARVKDAKVPYYLNFFANWCPTCARQTTVDLPLFNELGPDSPIIALRVNFNDTETDADEEALAKEFGIRYQHTLIVFNHQGQETKRFLGDTSAEQLRAAFTQAAGQ